MPVSRAEALGIARSYVAGLKKREGIPPYVVREEATIERPFGWVFFYEPDTVRDPLRPPLVLGNAPVIVAREDGVLHETGTSHPIEFYIEAFERYGTPHPPKTRK